MFRLNLYVGEQQVFSDDFDGDVVIGRGEAVEPPPFERLKLGDDACERQKLEKGTWKVIFFPPKDLEWSRTQVILKPSKARATIEVKNGGTQRSFLITTDGREVRPGQSYEVPLPVVIDLGGSKVIRVAEGHLRGLPGATLPPLSRPSRSRLPTLAALPRGVDRKEVIAWLHAATDVLQAAVSSDEFFDSAVAAAVQMADLDVARLLLYRGGEWHPQAEKQGRSRVSPARGPSRRVLTQVLEEKRTFWEVLDADESQTSLMGLDAVVAAPLLDRQGRVIGALYGERRQGGSQPISEVEAMLVELLARGVAAGLARQEVEYAAVALQRELEIGRQIQLGFLPVSLPQSPNWEIATKFEPAREVSGDFYDVFSISENHIGLVIADVCNKGVGPALFMALFRSLIRAFSQQGIARDLTGCLVNQQLAPGPQENRHLVTLVIELNVLTTIALTNNYVAEIHGEACMFATLFFGVLDTTTGNLHYVNAGHDPPIHIGPRGVKARLNTTGPIVGVEPHQPYAIQKVTLEPGDLLLCYTDGVTESRSPKDEFFSEKRLLEVVNRPATSAKQILDLVEESVNTHTAGKPPYDDVTMLAVYRVPAAGQNRSQDGQNVPESPS